MSTTPRSSPFSMVVEGLARSANRTLSSNFQGVMATLDSHPWFVILAYISVILGILGVLAVLYKYGEKCAKAHLSAKYRHQDQTVFTASLVGFFTVPREYSRVGWVLSFFLALCHSPLSSVFQTLNSIQQQIFNYHIKRVQLSQAHLLSWFWINNLTYDNAPLLPQRSLIVLSYKVLYKRNL